MRQLSTGDKKQEISEEDYLAMLRRLVKGNCAFAEAIHNYHASGFADWKNTFRMNDVWNNDIAIALTDQINDGALISEFKLLKKHWQKLQKVDVQISEWLAKYVGLSTIKDQSDKLKLERKLKKIVITGPNGRVQGPVWAMEPTYQKFVVKSQNYLIEIKKSEVKIDLRIEELLTRLRSPDLAEN